MWLCEWRPQLYILGNYRLICYAYRAKLLLRCLLSGAYSVAQLLRERLQEPPSDGSVSFDKRTEFPEREPVANQVGFGGYRGRTRAAVDQGDLAEMLARAERREVDAFARNFCLSGGYDEEGGAPRAFHDDSFALRKSPFLEQTGDLLGLPPIHAGEELDALEGGDRITRRWAGGGAPLCALPVVIARHWSR